MEGVPAPNTDVKRKRYVVRPPTMPNGIGFKLARSKSKLKEKVGSRLTRQESSNKFLNADEDASSLKHGEGTIVAEEPFQFEDATDDESVQGGSQEASASSPPAADGSNFHAVSPPAASKTIPESAESRLKPLSSTLDTPPVQLEKGVESPDALKLPEIGGAVSALEDSEAHELTAISDIGGTGSDKECTSNEPSSVPAEEQGTSLGRSGSSLGPGHANGSIENNGPAQNGTIHWSGSVTDLMASLNDSESDEEIDSSVRRVERGTSVAFKMHAFVISSLRFVLYCALIPLRLYLRSAGIRARRWNRISPVADGAIQQENTRGVLADELAVNDAMVAESVTPSQHKELFPIDVKNSVPAQTEAFEHVSTQLSLNCREAREDSDQSRSKLSGKSADLKRSIKTTLSKGRLSRKGSMQGPKKLSKETADEEAISKSSPVSAKSLNAALSEEKDKETPDVSGDSTDVLNDGIEDSTQAVESHDVTGNIGSEFMEQSAETSQNDRQIENTFDACVLTTTLGTRSGLDNDVRSGSDSQLNSDGSQVLYDDTARQSPIISCNPNTPDDTSFSADPAALVPAKSAQRDDYNEYETTTDDGIEQKERILHDEYKAAQNTISPVSSPLEQVSDKKNLKNAPKALLRSLGGLRRPAEETKFASARSARKTAMLLTDILTNEMGAVCSTRRGALRLIATKDSDTTPRLSTKINIDPLDDYSCNVTFLRERGDKSGNDAFLSFASDAHRRFIAHTSQGKPTVL